MAYTQRQIDLAGDLRGMLALADRSALGAPHIADWPYRFGSWALDDPRNTQLWLDAHSAVLGWAVMQTPFWAIDCVAGPEAPAGLYREMLGWAQVRAAKMSAQGQGRSIWFVSIDATCLSQRHDLEALGFVDLTQAAEDPWSKVLFRLADNHAPAPAQLPAGMQIRSLNHSTEIEAYVDLHRAVFQSTSMTTAWRTRAVAMPAYDNALDLVVASETGDLYGFCVAWVRQQASGEVAGQIEPLGVREDQRGQKFSQALLGEAIHRLRQRGAGRIYVETDRGREAAMAAYSSLGFVESHSILVYRYTLA